MSGNPAADRLPKSPDRVDTLQNALVVAEKLALRYFDQRSELSRLNKSATNFVSEADCAVEERIRQEIAQTYPEDRVVGEEMGGQAKSAYWLVDPIDGTSNFLSGIPLWAISIAYVEDGHPIFGGISIPMLGRSLIGGRDVSLRDIGRLSGTAGGTPLVFGIGGNEFWSAHSRGLIEAKLKPNGLVAISLGSCATSLALTASGEMAGYAEGNVGFWDIAAGVALCEAARLSLSYTGKPGPNESFITVAPRPILKEIDAATCNLTNVDKKT